MTGTSWWQTPYEHLSVAPHDPSGRRFAVIRFDLPELARRPAPRLGDQLGALRWSPSTTIFFFFLKKKK